MTPVRAPDFPSGTDPVEVFGQYWSNGKIRLLGSGLDVSYASDEARIKGIALSLRQNAAKTATHDPHKACAMLAVAGLFHVMRLWCRAGMDEFAFWVREIQLQVWFAKQLYPGISDKDAWLVWVLYHELAEAGDKSRPAYLEAHMPGFTKPAETEPKLREQFALQLARLQKAELELAELTERIRAARPE